MYLVSIGNKTRAINNVLTERRLYLDHLRHRRRPIRADSEIHVVALRLGRFVQRQESVGQAGGVVVEAKEVEGPCNEPFNCYYCGPVGRSSPPERSARHETS